MAKTRIGSSDNPEENRSKSPGLRPFTGRRPSNVEDSRRELPSPKPRKSKSLQEIAKRRLAK